MKIELPTDTDHVKVIHGDCKQFAVSFSPHTVDAIVTDPPYGLEFMGKEWDSLAGEHWRTDVTPDKTGRGSWLGSGKPTPRYGHNGAAMQEWFHAHFSALLPTVKPGGYLAAFGGSRTQHRLACAIEDAGWEIRDCILWLYGTGFPKGKGCLKPAYEPIILARRPGPKVLPLGIDECRVAVADDDNIFAKNPHTVNKGSNKIYGAFRQDGSCPEYDPTAGRYPANILHDGSDEVLEAFAAFGEKSSGAWDGKRTQPKTKNTFGEFALRDEKPKAGDSGTAARFFYCAKASKSDRGEGNTHPTVKPTDLMRWLVRLVCPVVGTVLDPFAGSGTTGKACQEEGRKCLLIEQDAGYVEIIKKRLWPKDTLFS